MSYNTTKSETNQIAPLVTAIAYATEKHKDQTRKNALKQPYVTHPIGVAYILSEITDDIETLQAAILHDTLEDTNATVQELTDLFGTSVCSIVQEVTDDKSLPKDVRKKMQISHATTLSRKAKMVKLADKIHNLSDLLAHPPVGWSPERIQGYFVWSKAVIDAIGFVDHRLSLATNILFMSTFTYEGKVYKAIPEGDCSVFLEEYYKSMSVTKD